MVTNKLTAIKSHTKVLVLTPTSTLAVPEAVVSDQPAAAAAAAAAAPKGTAIEYFNQRKKKWIPGHVVRRAKGESESELWSGEDSFVVLNAYGLELTVTVENIRLVIGSVMHLEFLFPWCASVVRNHRMVVYILSTTCL